MKRTCVLIFVFFHSGPCCEEETRNQRWGGRRRGSSDYHTNCWSRIFIVCYGFDAKTILLTAVGILVWTLRELMWVLMGGIKCVAWRLGSRLGALQQSPTPTPSRPTDRLLVKGFDCDPSLFIEMTVSNLNLKWHWAISYHWTAFQGIQQTNARINCCYRPIWPTGPDKLTAREAERQTDRQTGMWAARHDVQTNRLTSILIDEQTEKHVGKQTDI